MLTALLINYVVGRSTLLEAETVVVVSKFVKGGLGRVRRLGLKCGSVY